MSTPKSLSIHANMVVIDEIGTLITGKPKQGKSELSLLLLERGHTLVADDCTELSVEQGRILASCAPAIQKKLQITGLGLLDVTKHFGASSFCHRHPLHVGIHLDNSLPFEQTDPLNPIRVDQTYLNTSIPTFLLPNRNQAVLALLIEIIIRQYKLTLTKHPQRNEPCKENA